MSRAVSELTEYAVRKGWIEKEDRVYISNLILDAIGEQSFEGLEEIEGDLRDIHLILQDLCDIAYANGIVDGNSAAYYDLLDTKLMGLITPKPSEVIAEFKKLYAESPQKATDWYYEFSNDTNYIRRDRIKKDRKWTVDTEYGTLDITINLSKPEKDPRAIAAAGKAKSSGYPKCLLCIENEGYAGHLNHPARQNHRIIPIRLNERDYFLQYSPYVYYNEHCIVLNKEHTPMHIDRAAFENLLDFVTVFPHYFIGSNADLPIVGGSVLSHDHYQGGHYEFAMARAGKDRDVTIRGFEDVNACIVKWPMSVIRLRGAERTRIIDAAEHILNTWRSYDDEDAFIFHETDGEAHNTITPIARRRGEDYELDLVLRNNITTAENPLGVYHPHADKHHIKKENIGLIEVMGLAVLPARLKDELANVADAIINHKDFASDPAIASHEAWAKDIMSRYDDLNESNINEIIEKETGIVFAGVLEDAGVFKRNEEGSKAFDRFINSL